MWSCLAGKCEAAGMLAKLLVDGQWPLQSWRSLPLKSTGNQAQVVGKAHIAQVVRHDVVTRLSGPSGKEPPKTPAA
eukprot:2858053-Amphidinium_carterae.1